MGSQNPVPHNTRNKTPILSRSLSLSLIPEMPRRGGSHRRYRPEGAMSSCNLPPNIVADILSRLPVKTLVRFRCVCKPLKTLVADPKFITAHYNRTKNDRTLLVHSRHDASANQTISLLHTENPDSAPNLDHPFPPHFLVYNMQIVGSINGVVCLDSPPHSVFMTLWNPATKQYRYLPCGPCPNFGNIPSDTVNTISAGFAFDSVKNDYKVIRMYCFKKELRIQARAEVFSVNSGAWREIKVDVDDMFDCNWAAVVKGVPYWMGLTPDSRKLFFWFDAVNEVLRQLPAPGIGAYHGARLRPVNYKDSFAVLVYSAGHVLSTLDGLQGTSLEGNTNCVDVWVMEEKDSGGGSSWSKKLTVGPILGVERLVGCSKNGDIVVENSEGMLLVYNPSTEEVKNVGINEARARSFLVCSYSESLVSMRGFVRVGTLDEKFFREFTKKDKNRYRS